ncbi:MAG: hypothetical protein OZSIB_0375 [Candidatus Ozemobacter sibiricus]|uniref:Serine aminopeptidase S33 domain-containing protein n=1 Tax=Candidatus Ozemobacter sibiricus TaxID=2268124 RepID=A0A367ZLQ6_9BACT|nr:MAG: hypothetical protein OZSIB_0375 [Candidatus Ozemobacter sibiricus]
MDEARTRYLIDGRELSVLEAPARADDQAGQDDRAIILLHGLTASAATMKPQIELLTGAGFVCLAPDAPHHGPRDDGFLAAMHEAPPTRAHACLLDIVTAWIDEVAALQRALRAAGKRRLAVVGVSMGGHTALGAMLREPRPDVCVPLISTPSWEPRRVGAARDPRDVQAPVHFPERFPPTPLLAITAGRDSIVPPGPMRAFVATLRPLYAAFPERLHHRDFPESDHVMRPEDWQAAWQEVLAWLARWLPPAPPSRPG